MNEFVDRNGKHNVEIIGSGRKAAFADLTLYSYEYRPGHCSTIHAEGSQLYYTRDGNPFFGGKMRCDDLDEALEQAEMRGIRFNSEDVAKFKDAYDKLCQEIKQKQKQEQDKDRNTKVTLYHLNIKAFLKTESQMEIQHFSNSEVGKVFSDIRNGFFKEKSEAAMLELMKANPNTYTPVLTGSVRHYGEIFDLTSHDNPVHKGDWRATAPDNFKDLEFAKECQINKSTEVSDIVCVHEDNGERNYYRVAPVGFEKVSDEVKDAFEKRFQQEQKLTKRRKRKM